MLFQALRCEMEGLFVCSYVDYWYADPQSDYHHKARATRSVRVRWITLPCRS